ncbi:MAG: RagB/SusD family nutrient uptake outer membrane protein, partial [Paludibacter sp.]
EGEARFLRGYFNFHIIRAWGGMPYITKVFTPNDKLDYPRLSYAACSDSIEKDLLIAAEKLPVDWDATATGQITQGTNAGRFTKGAAYALLGKVMLYAGSPLMNGDSNGGDYVYNKEYCRKAAKYFWEVLKLSAIGGGSTYDLLPWSEYSNNFFSKDGTIPGTGKEGVLNHTINSHLGFMIGDLFNTMNGWGNAGCGPTENYVEYFGMNDGTRFDPAIYNTPSNNPFLNRDPRFYKNIIYDGDTLYDKVIAKFYLGGADRGGPGLSMSGYGWRKFRDNSIGPNAWVVWSHVNQNLPIIRLADVYLMYAEAVNEAYGCNVEPASVDPELPDCHITAIQAVKAVRARVIRKDGTPLPLPAEYYTDDNAMRETIRQERAVELAFEGHRWYDLRRWYVGDQPKYKRMDVLDCDEAHTYFKVRSYATKTFEKKHFWLPILDSQIQISSAFKQNPGW